MRLLLDTYGALRAVTGSARLPASARRRIHDADEGVVSAATVWEVAINHALGPHRMPVSSAQALEAFDDAGYRLLPVRAEHAVRVESLPPIHRDPFDRLLVAQALVESLTLMTRDPVVATYSDLVLRVED